MGKPEFISNKDFSKAKLLLHELVHNIYIRLKTTML